MEIMDCFSCQTIRGKKSDVKQEVKKGKYIFLIIKLLIRVTVITIEARKPD